MSAMALHLPLSDSGQLTFMAHGNGQTASFDVSGAAVRPDARVYPNYEARGWTGLCCNITKAQARQLRDVLSVWIGDCEAAG